MKIINQVKESITPDFISKISSELGENETSVSNAIQAYVPILLGSVLEKKETVSNLFESIKTFGTKENVTNLSALQKTPDIITGLKNKLFGSDVYSISDTVAEYSGLSETSSSKILDLTAMKAFGTLGKEIDSNQIGENDFFKLIKNSKDEILKLLPVGLSLSALGFGAFWKPALKKETVDIPSHNYSNKKKKSSGGFLKTLIPILLLLLAAFFLFKYCKGKSEEPVVEDANVKRITTDTIKVPKEVSSIHLDGDINLKAYQNGLEDQIITFIHSPEFNTLTEEQLKTKWFDFDNVNFVFGKTDQLEPGSEVQVENLTAILKEYPGVKIKIGAYTDRKGDDKLNKEISQKRADFLKSELTKQGVGTQVVSAEGYGEEFAKVDESASDEERASDRKMSLRFTK
ncbi:Outer membrane protein OmpA [Chishuiella changwenlii]|uniref:Outer membrane protein OmpA n=1 Tax=Chishuiella changwenlii TaxID=1434701 RepID=A0A1M6YXX3_9FLAO|nr:OmpA family protein [Chishuiella changwenlii]GGE87778.1 hypothetical protein GCM10010984_01910 [Chishuiella changwenlii]SHL23141.1 Outer membrane protein OmpA [Chishuiella changwenlii]